MYAFTKARILAFVFIGISVVSAPQSTVYASSEMVFSKELITKLEDHAINEHPMAQSMLGIMHLYGYGLPKNTKRAKIWFELAAAQGEPVALYELGLITYRDGDANVASNLMKVSAEKGFYLAKQMLYLQGMEFDDTFKLPRLAIDTEGLSQSKTDELLAVTSYEFLNKLVAFLDEQGTELIQAGTLNAAQHAHLIDAYDSIVNQSQIARLKVRNVDPSKLPKRFAKAKKGTGDELISAKQLKDLERFASRGQPAAQTMLAILYSRGDLVSKNPERALNYFHKAATRGEPVAQYQLYRIYLGRGDSETAEEYLRMAAKNKFSRAERRLQLLEQGTALENKEAFANAHLAGREIPASDHRMTIVPKEFTIQDFINYLTLAAGNTEDRGGTGTRIRGRDCNLVGRCTKIGRSAYLQQVGKLYDALILGIGQNTFDNLRLETEPVFSGRGAMGNGRGGPGVLKQVSSI